MAEPALQIEYPGIGAKVTLLVHSSDRPSWSLGTIVSDNPFQIELSGESADLFTQSRHVLIIHDAGRGYHRAEGLIKSFEPFGDGMIMTLHVPRWETVDSRDNPRFDVSVQAVVRSIYENDTEYRVDDQIGLTRNISLSGAWIEVDQLAEAGTLVEFRALLRPGVTIRALGIVAHASRDRGGMGIHFVDYIGSARYQLHQYLTELA